MTMKTVNTRTTEYDIDDVFLKRFSPRAMSGEIVAKDALMTLFESARFAPSSNNIQPWRFIYAIKGTPDFDLFLSFLKEFNQFWCKNAGALVIVLSKNTLPDDSPSLTHSFDTGLACENLALQCVHMGLVNHMMGGFEMDVLRSTLGIADMYTVETMIAIGHPGDITELPEKYQARETPSTRKNLEEIIFEGREEMGSL